MGLLTCRLGALTHQGRACVPAGTMRVITAMMGIAFVNGGDQKIASARARTVGNDMRPGISQAKTSGTAPSVNTARDKPRPDTYTSDAEAKLP
jgi:hypothetical protein